MNNDILLSLKDVSFAYNDDEVLHNINLDIKKGEFIGIVGLNGSGKSTLLKLILGVNKPTLGSVNLAQGVRMGYVNQTTSTEEGGFPATIYEVVALGLRKKPFSRITKDERVLVLKTLEIFNLKALRNKSTSTLSGGQAQKVKIAKVLVSNPDIIVLDEPTAGIDLESEDMLIEMINHLHAMKKTIIFVSHNPSNLDKCDAVYHVRDKGVFLNA
ncbi:MAG: ATP-binding cassette domain-containing protein [Acholeplasmatales bacterium]|nr:ATP-binding cassette domain-containing protein [Acholeplasmatales bacterium]